MCKQKTEYEMRIRDGSSDVCSSDLRDQGDEIGAARHREERRVGAEMVEDEARIFRHQHPADRAGGAADTDHRSDRMSVVVGKSVSVRVDLGCRRLIQQQFTTRHVSRVSY